MATGAKQMRFESGWPLRWCPGVAKIPGCQIGHIRLDFSTKNRQCPNLKKLPHNFMRIHQSLRVTSAMASGTTDYIWIGEKLLGTEIPD